MRSFIHDMLSYMCYVCIYSIYITSSITVTFESDMTCDVWCDIIILYKCAYYDMHKPVNDVMFLIAIVACLYTFITI